MSFRADCAHCENGECSGFYIENGIRHCLKGGKASATFKAKVGASGPEDIAPVTQHPSYGPATTRYEQILQLMKEIVALAEKYRKQRTASQLATLEYLRTRLSKLQVQARKIAEEEAAEKFQKVKRTALEMAHPWGFMCDLGLNMSDRSLEAADRVGLLDMHKTDYGRSFLANPLAIEAMRFR